MGTATWMMCFTLDKKTFDSEEAHELYQSLPNVCFNGSAELQTVCDCGERGDKMITATSDDGSHVIIHLYHFAYLTVDITFVVEDIDQIKPLSEPFTLQNLSERRKNLENHLGQLVKKSERCKGRNSSCSLDSATTSPSFRNEIRQGFTGSKVDRKPLASEDDTILSVPIRRGPGITWTYGQTGDERLFETDYEEIVFEADSKWQNIKIAKSREFGNVLLLDNDIMLGESDLVYTETLLGLGRNEFKDKTILILGGGDGGILHELLKMSPAYVLMAEIDEEVIKACSKHMKKVCGDTLEKWEGTNYKIKICDCILELKEALTSGTKYDYVINDLTEFSVDKDKYGFEYPFETSCTILEFSMKILKSGGKYLARGNCLSARNYRNQFEKDVRTLGYDFTRTDVHVPSFLETYSLYEVVKKETIDA